jgi:hypothetical protein
MIKINVFCSNRCEFNRTSLSFDTGRWSTGQIGVVMAFALAAMLGLMALAVDVSLMYVNHAKLQTSVDGAALAGATYINGGLIFPTASVASGCGTQPDDASKAACSYAASNGLAVDSVSLKITESSPNITVWAQRSVPSYFGTVIGGGNHTVSAAATAQSTSAVYTLNNGLFPMGVQCNSPCSLSSLQPADPVSFGQKFSPTGNASGNWQWLALGGGGASTLGSNVQNGASGSYSIGSTVATETGNVGSSGQVSTAWKDRMSSCPSIADPCQGGNPDDIPANDPCLVTVPAVNFSGANGKTSLTIEAFAEVYIEPTSTSKNISACFVKTVDGNTVSGGTSIANLGATTPPILVD